MPKEVPLSALEPVFRGILNEGGSVVFTPTGKSMQPMLRHRMDQVTLESIRRKPQKYDIYLYRRPDGSFVLHRLVKIKGDELVFRGDNQFEDETGIRESDLIGLVTGFTRNGKNRTTDSPGYLLYERVWVGSLEIRRVLRKGRRVMRSMRQRMRNRMQKG